MSSKVISMCVTPVMVRKKLSNRVVKTYAMLDTCSQATFAKEYLLREEDISYGKKSSEALEDLEVAQASNEKAESERVKLPCTYTEEDLAMDSNALTTIDEIKRWDYLNKIKTIINANDNIEVTFLIGANCVKDLEPRELIASKNGGPYAFKTLLEWCIVGPVYSQNKSEIISCNRIMVKSVVPGLPLNPYFTQSNKVRDTSIEGTLTKMYKHNFVEHQLQHHANKISINYDTSSRNDRRFLDLIDQKVVKVDVHYELPLPLIEEDIRLPNNRVAGKKPLETLRNTFKRMINSSKNTRSLEKN